MRAYLSIAAGLLSTAVLLWPSQAGGKVGRIPLSNMVENAELIAVVSVDRVWFGIPWLWPRMASAQVLEVWKGSPGERVHFRASPTWTCDVSRARRGELAVVFLERDRRRPRWALYHSGRGRLPVREHAGRSWAAFEWDGLEVPDSLELGVDVSHSVDLEALRGYVDSVLAGEEPERP